MRNKSKDIGLEYIQSLNMRAARDTNGVYNALSEKFDKDKAGEVIGFIEQRFYANGNSTDVDNQSFYEFKNQDLELSLAITGCYDANYIRKVCNWIDKNRDLFRGTILEVGCDTGVFSCFLAEQFPDSKIVSIDLCEEAIENAKQLAERRHISNAEFRNCSIEEVKETFDVVFSSKVAHETFGFFEDMPYGTLLNKFGEFCKEKLTPYAETLNSCLNENGILVSIERIGKNPLLLGWLLALNEQNLKLNTDLVECFETFEADTECVFTTAVATKGGCISEEEIYSGYGNMITTEYEFNSNPVNERCAEYKLHVFKRNLIEGYNAYGINPGNGEPCFMIKMAVWDTEAEEAVLFEQTNLAEGIYQVEAYSSEALESMLSEIRNMAQNLADNGFTVYKLGYEDGEQSEGEIVEGDPSVREQMFDQIMNMDGFENG